ncbi:hypothetical protein ADL19_22210 [Streptomyces purpurogeneiscleroticus]|nr:hypothetical protein ADL19_22210 [Streptomyces purpurogeneiscleroticus]
MRVFGVKRSVPDFLMRIGCDEVWSLPKVVAKDEVALDIGRSLGEAVQLYEPPPRMALVLRRVAPPRQSELAPPCEADCFEVISAPIQVMEVADDRHEIQNGLCCQTWDSGRSDMVDGK